MSIFDAAGPVCRQPGETVFEIGVRVVPVHAGRLDLARDGSRPLARAPAASKHPFVSANGHRPDPVINPVVVLRKLWVIDELLERSLALDAVV
jgi:hypothetical protein